MSGSNKRKSDFLGVPYGTACGKLRKLLLFKYVRKAEGGDVLCWDCKESIESPDDFTIQHIKPWLHEDLELFWDLENISFSHRACNKPNRIPNKKICPEGFSWCKDCKKFLSVEEFWNNNTVNSRNGLDPRCKICKNNRLRSWRQTTGRRGKSL